MNYVKILGASGSKARGHNTTSFQIFKDIVVDAGNILNALGDEASYINHIFLTHSHADHISDLPFVIESFFDRRTEPLIIYALEETIETLKKHSFNDEVWPDFTKIKLPNSETYSLILKPIKLNEIINIGDYKIKAIYANHTKGSCGFVITKMDQSFIISGDTYKNPLLWKEINENKTIKALIIECSFPDRLKEFSKKTQHLSPCHIVEEMKNLKRNDISVFFYHLKPSYEKELYEDIQANNLLDYNGKILREGDVIHIDTGDINHDLINEEKFAEIMRINHIISSEHDKNKLFTNILTSLRKFTNADGGTLYIKSKDDKKLDFEIIQNEKLDIFLCANKNEINLPSLPIYLENGNFNKTMVAVVSCNEKRIINIEDVYQTEKYSFDGTKKFDKQMNYRSKSMLVIPLINHDDEVIGVIQLINKKSNNEISKFNKFDEKILKSLSSQAAMAITNIQLILSLEEFINSFISTIAKAIDAKSPYTQDHIKKVEKLAILLAKAIHKNADIYKDVEYNKNDFRKISLAAWMHDIGKISTPENIIDKATKLEKIFDRIELIKERFEKIKKLKEIEYLKKRISKKDFETELTKLDEYLNFIQKINIGSEFMDDEYSKKLDEILEQTYKENGEIKPLITQDEYYNLSIKKGTLTKEEIEIIKGHAKLSYEMIKNLSLPKKYKEVVDIASNHHEKLNGKGYPRGLNKRDISLEDRIMIFADIFEALTSSDRPYKKAMKLSQVKEILYKLGKNGEIDQQLNEFFFGNAILDKYIEEELESYQDDIR